jgi:hypothetical protein
MTHCTNVTLNIESLYPLQQIVPGTEGRDKINYWVRCLIFGRLKGYVKRTDETKGRRLIYIIESRITSCGGGVEYLHRSPASRRRRRKRKFRIWDRKIWSRVPRDSYPRMIARTMASSNCKLQIRPLIRESVPHQQTSSNCLTVIKI